MSAIFSSHVIATMYSLLCPRALFYFYLVSVFEAVLAADPCPAQSNGLTCDYIDGIAHNNSAPYCLCAGDIDTVEIGQRTSITISSWPLLNDTEELRIQLSPFATVNGSFLVVLGPYANRTQNETQTVVELIAIRAGKAELSFTYVDNYTNETVFKNLQDVVRPANVVHLLVLNIVIAVVGWIYFAAWSVSFYPQVFLNFWRRSVIGLNFDFLVLNITGFLCYSAFNLSLYISPVIQDQYFAIHPGGVNPVQINDVVFAVHALALSSFTGFQALIFKRGEQKVSKVTMVILALMLLVMVVCAIVSLVGPLSWLNYLYVLSYIKLAVTLIKYVPQAWMNFRRKSTEGWSIGNVLLDFTGGSFSLLQMFMLSYNYDDWASIFGDPTKFGLGLFSILFDLLFMFQHYVLYRNAGKDKKSKDGEEEKAEKEKDEDKVKPNQYLSKLQRRLQSKLPSFPCCKSFSVNRPKGDDDETTRLVPN